MYLFPSSSAALLPRLSGSNATLNCHKTHGFSSEKRSPFADLKADRKLHKPRCKETYMGWKSKPVRLSFVAGLITEELHIYSRIAA